MKNIILTVLLIPNAVFASGWSESLKLTRLQVYGDAEKILAFTEGGDVYTNGCKANSWEIETTNSDGLNRIYSTLLAAYISGKKVNFYYENACGTWDYHQSKVIYIAE